MRVSPDRKTLQLPRQCKFFTLIYYKVFGFVGSNIDCIEMDAIIMDEFLSIEYY